MIWDLRGKCDAFLKIREKNLFQHHLGRNKMKKERSDGRSDLLCNYKK